ncbi:hypothetical protein MBLNU230_g4769t1 [Neophaeotheca triangularis]
MTPSREGLDGLSSSQLESNGQSTVVWAAATICLIWFVAVVLVCAIGYTQLWRYFSSKTAKEAWTSSEAPDITIIRPLKGLEPSLYDCLASTFRQDYPHEKLHIRFCIPDRNDSSLPVLQRLLNDFPNFDAQILVEAEDPELQRDLLGPNPKVRNMSRAYREAVGNLIWIIDCNVWIAKGVCGRMVAKLHGQGTPHRNKFVHQLPLVIDTIGTTTREETQGLLNPSPSDDLIRTSSASVESGTTTTNNRTIQAIGGGRLEECFMSSSHAKFYTAINTVLIAPCIVGKSTMFRRSHLDSLTDNKGIDYFSENICEDHLIGDLLWKGQVPEEQRGETWGKHAMVFGDLAVQPMAGMSVAEYVRRRVRWLRVRKFTVTLATLVEPGTESFLCSLYGAFAFTTLPIFNESVAIPQSWTAFAGFWLAIVVVWCFVDWTLYRKLHSAASIEVDENTPAFARPPRDVGRRPLGEWLLSWLGREALALPIWMWAFWGGTQVEWRGRRFRVGMDMKVHELENEEVNGNLDVSGSSKARRD